MRLFIGIPLAPELVEALQRVTRNLRSPEDKLRWASPESWHITLQFLGETSADKLDCVLARLGEIRAPRVPVRLEGTGVFDRAGVFFVDVKVSPELQQLHQQVVASTAPCGFAPEDRFFHPHVTLARAKGPGRNSLRKLKALADPEAAFPRFPASEFLLYEVFLGHAGSRYEVRARFPLGL